MHVSCKKIGSCYLCGANLLQTDGRVRVSNNWIPTKPPRALDKNPDREKGSSLLLICTFGIAID